MGRRRWVKYLKRKIPTLILAGAVLLFCCAMSLFSYGRQTGERKNERMRLVATTTMLADLAREIGGETLDVECLMGPGVDPHLYQASAGNVVKMQQADIVLYNGLHLEGKMADVFAALNTSGRAVICIADGIDPARLLCAEGNTGTYDPHIWFDICLWKDAAIHLAERLTQADPAGGEAYERNLSAYLERLDALEDYTCGKIAQLPETRRVLITAHDAFQYFGAAYGFQVRGLQGISTGAEAGTADVRALAAYIAENRIKAIFVESSVPPKTVEALQAAVRAKGFEVEIGGQLYSDSLGDAEAGTDSYISTWMSNIDTITDALGGCGE